MPSLRATKPMQRPTKVPKDPKENNTAKKCVKNEYVKIPPNRPSSVSIGQGPFINSFVIPSDPANTDIKYVIQNHQKLNES